MKPAGAFRILLVLAAVSGSWLLLRSAGELQRTFSTRISPQAIQLNNLGVAYMNQQRAEEAKTLFVRAYAADRRLTAARVNEAIANLSLQRFEPARTSLEDIVKSEPDNVHALYNLGLIHRILSRPDQATAAFQRVVALKPDDANAYYFLGGGYEASGKYAEAVVAYEHVLTLAPYNVSAEFGLARVFQRLDRNAEAQQHLDRFQILTEQKLGVPMGLAYGDQGALSMAEDVVLPGAAPAAIPVRFASAADSAGIQARSATAAGACFLDYDNDGLADLFLANTLYRNLGGGRFADVTPSSHLRLDAAGASCAAADFDNDGHTDLAVGLPGRVRLFHNQADGSFQAVGQGFGVPEASTPQGLLFVDYDHDGDLDLYIAMGLPGPGNLLWRNNGNGTFIEVTQAAGLGGTPTAGTIATDFNNDRAVDFLVINAGKPPVVFSNQREGAFKAAELWTAAGMAPATGAAVADLDKDGAMDFVFTHSAKPALTAWRNVEGSGVEPIALPALDFARAWGVAAVDYDNDGWIDLALVGETASGRGQVRLLRNRGAEGYEDVSSGLGLLDIELREPRALVAADYDNDGDADLLITQTGAAVLLRNDGGNRNGWLQVRLEGLNDNKSGIGTKVEVFSGTGKQKWEISGAGYLGQSSLPLTAGLGPEKTVQTVRMLWPTGVVQDEVQLPTRKRHTVSEIDRRGSSCPVLFVWNGHSYGFVSDMLGAGVVGHWVSPGERNVSDPTEYAKVDGVAAAPLHGLLSFRLAEPMEELVYLDQVRLLAVDHPADFDVYPNEYFAANPPFPEFKVISTRSPRLPAGAWDGRGRDVLPALRERDRRYVDGFDLLPFKGFSTLHSIELDPGPLPGSGAVRLVMHGFIDYFSANSGYAAFQSGVVPISPYVEALNAAGLWVRVANDIGFPAGTARTMVADLTGRLPSGTRRIRISTNLNIYWDQILIDTTADQSSVRVTEVPLTAADLAHHGYPRAAEGRPKTDVVYVYDDVSPSGPYAHQAGNYTRYGDVLSLLTRTDDRLAVYGSGEEVALEFDPHGLPPLAAGWKRDYFFFADGFNKDMDFYAANSDTVGPLPFHGMKAYPPRRSSAPLQYQLQYNNRMVSDRATASYRFRFPD